MQKSKFIREIETIGRDLQDKAKHLKDLTRVLRKSSLRDDSTLLPTQRKIFDSFLAAVCEREKRAIVGATPLWHGYQKYEKDLGVDPVFTSQRAFGLYVGQFFERTSRVGRKYYLGLRFRLTKEL
jgi:hypothetical protein